MLLKMGLSNTQAIREVQSIVLQTFLMTGTLDCVQACQQAGKGYAQEVDNKPGHSLDPPHLHKFLAFMEAALDMPELKAQTQIHQALTDLLGLCQADMTSGLQICLHFMKFMRVN